MSLIYLSLHFILCKFNKILKLLMTILNYLLKIKLTIKMFYLFLICYESYLNFFLLLKVRYYIKAIFVVKKIKIVNIDFLIYFVKKLKLKEIS